jgi:carboxyl-terminal processing protease
MIREQALKKEKMDTREDTYAAIQKLLASLDDPFTRFLDPDKLASIRRGSRGSVTGGACQFIIKGL